MIAAATQNFATGKTWLNWFDVALVLVLLFGFWRGRTNGMTKESLPVAKWVVLVIAAGFGYQPLGDLLIKQSIIHAVFGKTLNEKTAAYVSSYLLIAGFVWTIFSILKSYFKEKIAGSNAFGSGEYYLGMISGVIRYACIAIFVLSLLNAPYYSTIDIQNAKAYNNKNFGGGLAGYSGDFFPTISEVQISVFKDSLTGPFIKDDMSALLVNTRPAVKPPVMQFGS